MIWARMLAYITGTVDQELLLRNEYLAAENRILRAQIKGRLLLSDAEKLRWLRSGEETERLVVRMAKENPGWGYDRIVGAMANLGHRFSDQAVGNILRRHDIPPASGDRFLHGGSAYAQRVDYVLRDVFHSFGEPEDMLGGSHISSGSRVDGTDGAQCDDGRFGFSDQPQVPTA